MAAKYTAENLSRALLCRRVDDGGRPFLVRAPVVQEALEILAARRAFIRGEESEKLVFLDVLRRWLPAGLYGRIKNLPASMLASYAIAWAFEGVKVGSDEDEESDGDELVDKAKAFDEMMTSFESEDFGVIIADYAAAFRIDPYDVMTRTPFPLLMAFRREAVRVRYRDMYEQMIAGSMPQAEPGPEKDRTIAELRRLAGIKTEAEAFQELPREEQDRLSEQAAKRFAAMFGKQYGMN